MENVQADAIALAEVAGHIVAVCERENPDTAGVLHLILMIDVLSRRIVAELGKDVAC